MDILNDTVRTHVFHTEPTSVHTCLCTYMCICNPPLQFYYFSQAAQILPPWPATQIFWWKYFFTSLSLLLLSPHTLMVCAVSPDPCKDRGTLMGLLFTSVGTKILPNENICLCSSHAQLSPKRNVLINIFFFKS